jgi:hypothetical protein
VRRIMKLGALALGLLVPLGAAASAQAAEPVPFTISEQVDFATGAFTFTATGPLCPSGTFVDNLQVFAPNPESSGIDSSGRVNLLFRTVYTCDDGSGTFFALKHVLLTLSGDTFTNTGPIQLLGGTGSYTGLVGHGVDNGYGQVDVFGVGQISGFVV